MFNWITTQFDIPSASQPVEGTFTLSLVAFSLAIAIFSSFMAFTVAGQAAVAPHRRQKKVLLVLGSLALGTGMWGMHFVGMLAFDLCTPVEYDFWLTVLSLLPGTLAAWVALNVLCRPWVTRKNIIIGGILVGAGIGCMHYSGMAAMNTAPLLRYDVTTFVFSIVVAVTLAMLSLWIRYGLDRIRWLRGSGRRVTGLASVVMGLAICAMHYTGMAASRFVTPPGVTLTEQESQISVMLAAAVTFFITVIITLVLGVSLLIKYRNSTRKATESERTLLAMMDTAVDAVVTFDNHGTILNANTAVTRILGYAPNELLGKNVNILVPRDRQYLYNSSFFNQSGNLTDEQQIIGQSKDVQAINRAGQRVPVRVGVGHTQVGHNHYFVAFISDIRERIAMESALRKSEAKFRSFFNNVPGIAYRCLNQPGWQWFLSLRRWRRLLVIRPVILHYLILPVVSVILSTQRI